MARRCVLLACAFLLAASPLFAQVRRAAFTAGARYVLIEVLDDDLIHVEMSAAGAAPAESAALATSPMVARTQWAGPASFARSGGTLQTGAATIRVDAATLCLTASDKPANRLLTRICPADLESDWKGFSLTREQIGAVYGLGQQFRQLASADGDWLQHRVREEQPSGQEQAHGNGFMPFGPSGMVGNVQVPVMYALGDGNLNYAVFLDNVYKQRWDFGGTPWQARMWGDQVRFYLMLGPDLRDLRADYLELTGRPPVPPRKAFGLWVSEFGYRNWPQIESLRTGLRGAGFPVDGFVLDLQWFGGVIANSPDSRMGALDWDTNPSDGNGFFFPDPDANVTFLANDHLGLVAIEESYVNEKTATFGGMLKAGPLFAYLPSAGRCDASAAQPAMLVNWFGRASMIDWSNAGAGAWVHENRRLPNLIRRGITAHWTDLGEPEKYNGDACYHGVETTAAGAKNRHGDVHNLYAFLWNKSIYDGYVRHNTTLRQRPFIVTRSGTAGSQRFGVAMWSGDIGSSLDLLATHLNAQLHMSFSGIDFYGSDIGGFRREGMPYNGGHSGSLQYQDELYTQWLANGAWFDVPVRPHTDNSFQTSKRYETSPDLVGHRASNLANLRQRYELTPYYYSLAYRAHLFGEPLVAPPVFYYQNDPQVRQMGHEKLIGRDLLVSVVAKHGEHTRNVYLPAGTWVNYHTRDFVRSTGQWIENVPTYVDGVFRLPVFARGGSLLPMMPVDARTKDAFGHRRDGGRATDLVVQVVPDAARSTFTLYEDDGATVTFAPDGAPAYATRTTELAQQLSGTTAAVTIGAAAGSYDGAPASRNAIVRLVVEDARATGVTLNGAALPERASEETLAASDNGWVNAGRNLVLMKSGTLPVGTAKAFAAQLTPVTPTVTANFVCDNAWTALGEQVVVTGGHPSLGSWDPAKGVALSPSIYWEYIYDPPPGHNGPGPMTPKWTGVARGLPASQTIEWKCVRRLNSGGSQFEPGANRQVTLPARGFAGTTRGSF